MLDRKSLSIVALPNKKIHESNLYRTSMNFFDLYYVLEILERSFMANPTGVENNKIITESGGRLNAYPNEPRMEVISVENSWGLHKKAETLNGRIAMIGFIIIIAIELLNKNQTFMDLVIDALDKYI